MEHVRLIENKPINGDLVIHVELRHNDRWIKIENLQGENHQEIRSIANEFAANLETNEVERKHYLDMALD